MATGLLVEVWVSGRKKRPEDEGKGFNPKPEGPEVFKAQRNHHALIKVKPLPGQEPYVRVRWPAATARSGPPDPPVEREIIRMGDKPLTRITYPDPYLAAEAKAAQRKEAA